MYKHKIKAVFRWVDIDEGASLYDYSFNDIIEQIRDWNEEMQTQYETIDDFNKHEEYHKIELNICYNV